MSAVYIRTRTGKRGKRFLVYFRRGGRGFPEEYGGSFKTMTEAKQRRDLIAGEIANGRDPRILLEVIRNPPPPAPGLDQEWEAFIAGRIDARPKTIANAELARRHWTRILGKNRDPQTVKPADVVAGIVVLSRTMMPGSISAMVSGLSQVLDYCDVFPNPTKSPKVRLPKDDTEEINPPTSEEWRAIRAQVKARSVLVFRIAECCGLRIGEACSLRHGDIDYLTGRLRIARANTKTARGQRWVPIPESLLDEIADTCPMEDRTAERRIFDLNEGKARADFTLACLRAGVAAYTPHDLRHRRCSLWLRLGIDPVQAAAWAGHAQVSMILDTYGHVVTDPEGDEWRGFWIGVYNADRRLGAAHVRHGEAYDG